MPMYTHICKKCHRKMEKIRSIADRDKKSKCPYCQGVTKRIPDAPRGIIGMADEHDHFDIGLGKHFHSKREKRDELARQNKSTLGNLTGIPQH